MVRFPSKLSIPNRISLVAMPIVITLVIGCGGKSEKKISDSNSRRTAVTPGPDVRPASNVTPASKTSPPQKTEPVAAANSSKAFKLDASKPVEAQWQSYLDAAKKHYAFTPEQTAAADAVYANCTKRAQTQRAAEASSSGSRGTKGAKTAAAQAKDPTAALSKLTDEFIYRIDGIARLDQIQTAKAGGFVSPRERIAPPRPEVGSVAPAFTLADDTGKSVSLASLKNKAVVLMFWSPGCGWCKKQMPDLQKLHDDFKSNGKVAIYGVNCRDATPGQTKSRDLLKQMNFTFPQLYGGDAASPQYEVQGFPALYVVGPDGKIIHKQRGYKADTATTLKPLIENAVKAG
ncbi:MAG TPA: TlpA disulfide reductase family protein [Phycisphaerae bacterium]|nr:TlpA disulfide reductase family protein [Phycisphaerae bacterium]